MTPDAVLAVGGIVVMNLGGLASFFVMLDRRLTRLEATHDLARDSGRCPFHDASQAHGAAGASRVHH